MPFENSNIAQSEIAGGCFFKYLENGTVLCIETQNRRYTLVKTGESTGKLSGHPEYCPEPIDFHLNGSTWGGSMLKLGFIGRGMRMEGTLSNTAVGAVFLTSIIREITVIS